MAKDEVDWLHVPVMTNAQRFALLACSFWRGSNIIGLSGGAMPILPGNALA